MGGLRWLDILGGFLVAVAVMSVCRYILAPDEPPVVWPDLSASTARGVPNTPSPVASEPPAIAPIPRSLPGEVEVPPVARGSDVEEPSPREIRPTTPEPAASHLPDLAELEYERMRILNAIARGRGRPAGSGRREIHVAKHPDLDALEQTLEDRVWEAWGGR